MSSKTASFETLKLQLSTLPATVLHADDNTPRAQCCLLERRHIHGADNQTPWRLQVSVAPLPAISGWNSPQKKFSGRHPNPIGSTPAIPRPRFMNTEPATRDYEWESTRLGSFEPRRNTYTSLMRGRVGQNEKETLPMENRDKSWGLLAKLPNSKLWQSN